MAQQPHVQDNSSGLVAAVNASSPTPTLPGTIPVGPSPTGMAFDPNNGMLYVASSVECCTSQNSSVTVIDTGSNSVVGNIKVPYATDLAVVESTDLLYISTHGFSDETVVMNAKTNQIQDIVQNLERSHGLAVDQSRSIVYMAEPSGNITALSYNGTKHLLRPITVDKGANLYNIAVNSETGKVYTSTGNNTIFAVDPSTNAVSKITLNYSAGEIFVFAVNPITNLVYVAGGNTVSIIDGSTDKLLSQTIQLQQPLGYALKPFEPRVVVNPLKNLIYVTHESGNFTSVIGGGTNTLISTVKMPDLPSAMAVNPKTGDVYVADYYTNSVSLWNPTLTQMVNLPSVAIVPGPFQQCCTLSPSSFSAVNPVDLAFNPNNNRIYVADYGANLVRVIDPEQKLVVANLNVSSPTAIVVTPSTNLVYVSAGGGDETYVIDGKTNAVIGHYTNLERSHGLAVDENQGKVYTAGTLSNNITAMWYNGTGLVQKRITIDKGSFIDPPGDIAVNSKTGMVYVTRERDRLLYGIDPATDSVTKIRLPVDPLNVAVNPNTNLVYVSGYCAFCTTILTVDGSTNRMLPQFLDIGAIYGGNLAVNPNTNTLFVTHTRYSKANTSPGILIINASRNALTDNVNLPFPPESIAFNPHTGTVYAGVMGTVGISSVAGNQRVGSIVQVVNKRLTFPSNIIIRPLLSATDLFPAGIGLGPHFGVWYDRVTLTNVGTADGRFLLVTYTLPGVHVSPDIVTPFSDVQVIDSGDNYIVYSVLLSPSELKWVDISLRIDPSEVNFAGGPLTNGQLFHIGDKLNLGYTIQLATLSPGEWEQIKSNSQGTSLIDGAIKSSLQDEKAFFDAVAPPIATICSSTATTNCQTPEAYNQTYGGRLDKLWNTHQVAPTLADYIAMKVSDRNLWQALSEVANVSVPGVIGTGLPPPSQGPNFGTVREMLNGMSNGTVQFGSLDSIDTNLNGSERLTIWGSWQREGANITGALHAGLQNLTASSANGLIADFASARFSKSVQSFTGASFEAVIAGGTGSIIKVADNPSNEPYVGILSLASQGTGPAKESIWKGLWQFYYWPNARILVSNFLGGAKSIKFEPSIAPTLPLAYLGGPVLSGDALEISYPYKPYDPRANIDCFLQSAGVEKLAGPGLLLGCTPGNYFRGGFDATRLAAGFALLCIGQKAVSLLLTPQNDPCRASWWWFTALLSAIDPNHMYAVPSGYIQGGATAGQQKPILFTVNFENLKNATAPAKDIKVEVSIDKSLDLSTFSAIAVSHPDKLQNVTIDSVTRQVTWYFVNISLPPNMNPPEGQGWVRYSIDPIANLTTDTSIKSQASVFFDFNPPIVTNAAEQIIDNDPPTTMIKPLQDQTSNPAFDVTWNGTDKGSGIASVLIFVSKDNTSNFQLLNMTSPNTAHFVGQVGHTYYFMSIGIDKVGNVEVKSMPDTSTTIVPVQTLNLWLIIVALVATIALVGGAFYVRSRRKSRPAAAVS